MTGYHTRWVRPDELAEDPERIAIREALAFGKAVYDLVPVCFARSADEGPQVALQQA